MEKLSWIVPKYERAIRQIQRETDQFNDYIEAKKQEYLEKQDQSSRFGRRSQHSLYGTESFASSRIPANSQLLTRGVQLFGTPGLRDRTDINRDGYTNNFLHVPINQHHQMFANKAIDSNQFHGMNQHDPSSLFQNGIVSAGFGQQLTKRNPANRAPEERGGFKMC